MHEFAVIKQISYFTVSVKSVATAFLSGVKKSKAGYVHFVSAWSCVRSFNYAIIQYLADEAQS